MIGPSRELAVGSKICGRFYPRSPAPAGERPFPPKLRLGSFMVGASYAPLFPPPPQDPRYFLPQSAGPFSVGAALPGTPPGGQNKSREALASRPHAQHFNDTKSTSRRNPLWKKSCQWPVASLGFSVLKHRRAGVPGGAGVPPAILAWPGARDQEPTVTD